MMPFSVSKFLHFFKKLLRKEPELIIEEAEITVIRHADQDKEENTSEVLNEIINTPKEQTFLVKKLCIDELLFAPCPLVNCDNYDNCSKNLFKCDWIKEEMLMMKDETN